MVNYDPSKLTEQEQRDIILLQKIQENDDWEAFEEVFSKHFKKLHAFCSVFVKDKDTAKDIVQSIFVQIWEKRKELNIHSSIGAYLSMAVRYKAQRTILLQKHHISTDGLLDMPASTLNPEQQIEGQSLQQLIIDHLPQSIIEIYTMKYIKGMKQKDIAQELNVSEATVERRIAKVKFYLKKLAAQLFILIILLNK